MASTQYSALLRNNMPAAHSELSFLITHDYPAHYNDRYSSSRKIVGSADGINMYTVNAMGFGSDGIRIAERIKARMIEKQIKTPCTLSMRRVSSMASEMLSGYRSDKKELIAYIVAHDIAGYGPISMVLEDAANIEGIVVRPECLSIDVYHVALGRCVTNLHFKNEQSARAVIGRLIEDINNGIVYGTGTVSVELQADTHPIMQAAPGRSGSALACIKLLGNSHKDIARLISCHAASPDMLAYLWLALEAGFSIVIGGTPGSGKSSLLVALGAFEDYSQVAIINTAGSGSELCRAPYNAVILQNGVDNRADHYTDPEATPDRVIMDKIHATDANRLFAGANLSVPFMASIDDCNDAIELIGRLAARPNAVEPHNLSMLDVGVFMAMQGEGKKRIGTIVEYRWLARNELMNKSMNEVEICTLSSPQGIDREALRQSKLIAYYADLNLISTGAALEEFQKRTEYLAAITTSGNSAADYINDYWAIT